MLEELPIDGSTSVSSSSNSPSSSSPTAPKKRSHPLFTDPLFSRSQEWKLSTSGLSAGDQFRGTGFGAGWEDGYGINCKFDSFLFFIVFRYRRTSVRNISSVMISRLYLLLSPNHHQLTRLAEGVHLRI